jgi:DNA-binding MarR family transcriptional regulator
VGESSSGIQTDQIIEFMISALHYRRYIMTMLPENLARQKEKIEKLYQSEGGKRMHDHDLFYRIGMVLTRSNEPPPMGELSKLLDVPLSTATRIIDGLVENGYAERVADPDDRRIVRVTLTEDGRELYGAMYNYVRGRIDEVLSLFSADERSQLCGLLQKLGGRLDNITE